MTVSTSDGQVHADEVSYWASLGARTDDGSQEATPVPNSENNAPVTSTEAPAGLPNVGTPVISDGGELSKGTNIGNRLTGNAGEERYQTWPEKIIRSGLGALALPGKVASGEIDPSSPQAVEQAFELAGMMVFGPAPISSKMTDGTLGSFIGVRAKSFDRNALAEAQILERNGENIDKVFEKTGMFRGADNRWRQEISDKNSKFNEKWWQDLPEEGSKTIKKLPTVLDHPELYKAYPELKNIDVVYEPKFSGAAFEADKNQILVGNEYKNSKETLLHEITHGIQTIEGFNKGGAPATKFKLRYENDVAKAEEEARSLLRERDKISVGQREDFSDDERKRILELKQIMDKNILYRKAALAEARYNYTRLSGEVEARNVETRMELGPEGRRISPRWTEDVHRNQQHATDTIEWATPYGYGNPYVVPPK